MSLLCASENHACTMVSRQVQVTTATLKGSGSLQTLVICWPSEHESLGKQGDQGRLLIPLPLLSQHLRFSLFSKFPLNKNLQAFGLEEAKHKPVWPFWSLSPAIMGRSWAFQGKKR